jgi:hypothetical protein
MSIVVPLGSLVFPIVVGSVLDEPAVIVAELAPVSSLSSSAGQPARLSPINTAPAVRTALRLRIGALQ